MITKKKSMQVMLVALMLYSGAPAQANYRYWNDWSKKVVATGASLVAAGGIIGLANWLTHETDEQMVARIDLKLREAQEHMSHAHRLLDIFGVQAVTPYEHERIVHDPCESVIYEFFVYLSPHVDSLTNYHQDIAQLISVLRTSRAKLAERITQAQQEVDAMTSITSMQAMIKKIDRMIPALQVLHDYVNAHKRYGKLFELESSMAKKYTGELEALQGYADNRMNLQQTVRGRLHKKQNREYPMIAYVDSIAKDIKRLEAVLLGLSDQYPERVRWAQILLENLSYIGASMRVDGMYRQEEQDRDRAQWHQENQGRTIELVRKQEFDVQQDMLHGFDQQRPGQEHEIYVNLSGTITTRK